ncbi:DUF7269 family protein [Haloarchaeobius sp. HRN-SO-5]|uniref:DUF7269 family protein n=1 Tax=Haloarchaeobius sp. HRN-SO-5 TaxID=3446118 RepID=UPI003EBB68B5
MRVPILDSPRFPTRTVLATVGTAAFVAAVLLAFLPVPLTPVRPYVAVLANEVAVFLLGIVGGGIGLWHLYGTRQESPGTAAVSDTPEAATYNARESTGADIDDTVEELGALPDSKTTDWWVMHERWDVEETVQTLAIDVLVRTENLTRNEAQRRVKRGEWTDDVRAANFLGGNTVPELPLRMQFYDWLSGEAYERHVRHTVDEIAARADLQEVETE